MSLLRRAKSISNSRIIGFGRLHTPFSWHGKPGQIELAGFVLDSSAWESIVGDLESPDAHDNQKFGSGDPVSGEMEEKAASAASHVSIHRS